LMANDSGPSSATHKLMRADPGVQVHEALWSSHQRLSMEPPPRAEPTLQPLTHQASKSRASCFVSHHTSSKSSLVPAIKV
jgi:hypothetical protein